MQNDLTGEGMTKEKDENEGNDEKGNDIQPMEEFSKVQGQTKQPVSEGKRKRATKPEFLKQVDLV